MQEERKGTVEAREGPPNGRLFPYFSIPLRSRCRCRRGWGGKGGSPKGKKRKATAKPGQAYSLTPPLTNPRRTKGKGKRKEKTLRGREGGKTSSRCFVHLPIRAPKKGGRGGKSGRHISALSPSPSVPLPRKGKGSKKIGGLMTLPCSSSFYELGRERKKRGGSKKGGERNRRETLERAHPFH